MRGQCFGLGALLAELGGEEESYQNPSVKAFLSGVGKIITALTLTDIASFHYPGRCNPDKNI